jgi:hypothetical protein
MSRLESDQYHRRFVGLSANEHAVSVNLYTPDSHAALHFDRYEKSEGSSFWTLAQEAVSRLVILKPDQEAEIDMGRPVGDTDLVKLPVGMKHVFYLRDGRGNRGYPGVPMNALPKDEEARKTRSIVAITHAMDWDTALAPDQRPHPELNEYADFPHDDLFSIFPGVKSPPLPDAPSDYIGDRLHESREFWRTHALVMPEDAELYQENDAPAMPPAYRYLEE